jgi:hypothetical protein
MNTISFKPYQQESDLFGTWAFRLPDGYPAWLSIQPDSSVTLLWSIGGAKPASNVIIQGDRISFYRGFRWQPFGNQDTFVIRKPITGRIIERDKLMLTVHQRLNGKEDTLFLFGKKMPPIPPKPDLSKVLFDEPVDLLAGGIESWVLTDQNKLNGWRLENGELINESTKMNFTAYGAYANLRTKQEFYDFELTVEYNVPVNGNSGIYLRGAYEVQVVDRDSRMQGIQGPGAIFGRIIPTVNAGKPGGEWNKLKVFLVDRHVTVMLNGICVIDNEPLEGCTGGGINADDTAHGPILLQGDHTSVKYKNMVMRPVISN